MAAVYSDQWWRYHDWYFRTSFIQSIHEDLDWGASANASAPTLAKPGALCKMSASKASGAGDATVPIPVNDMLVTPLHCCTRCCVRTHC